MSFIKAKFKKYGILFTLAIIIPGGELFLALFFIIKKFNFIKKEKNSIASKKEDEKLAA